MLECCCDMLFSFVWKWQFWQRPRWDDGKGTTSSSLRPVNTCPPPADLITMGRIYNNIAENSDLKKVDPHFQFSCTRPSINCLVNGIANQHFFSQIRLLQPGMQAQQQQLLSFGFCQVVQSKRNVLDICILDDLVKHLPCLENVTFRIIGNRCVYIYIYNIYMLC